MALRDDMTKHRVFVQRLINTEAKNIKDQLRILVQAATRAVEAGVDGRMLQHTLRNATISMPDIGLANMTDIAEYESKFTANVYNKYFETPIVPIAVEKLQKALIHTNIGVSNVKIQTGKLVVDEAARAKSLVTAYKQFGMRKADDVAQIIKDGYMAGAAKSTILQNVHERVRGLHATQADTLARTAVNYTTNIAKTETARGNKEIKLVQWVSTLEVNTCGYCEGLDKKVFNRGEEPDCPAHWNCACEVVAYEE